MRGIRTIFGGMAIALLAAATPALAQHPGGIPHHGGGRGRECEQQLITALGLTDAQQTALAALRKQTADSVQAIVASADGLHQQIHSALAAASPDACAIGKLMIQAEGVRQQIESIHKSAEASFVASLTADQATRYTAFLAAHPGCAAFPDHMRMPGPPA